MKSFIICLIFSLSIFSLEAQVKTIITHQKIEGFYYDEYSLQNFERFFHTQSLVNFKKSEASALVSYYCTTSKEIFDKYVLGGGFNYTAAQNSHNYDSTQSGINIMFKISFKYNNKDDIRFVRYSVVRNGNSSTIGYCVRFLFKYVEGEGFTYFIDNRENDRFIADLTDLFDSIKQSFLRVLLGIDKPMSIEEIELVSLLTSQDKGLHINILLELFKNKDKRLINFFDKFPDGRYMRPIQR